MANRFSRPAFADTQIQSSFVPMPLDFLQSQIDRKQKTFDQREAEVLATRDHWSKMQSLSADQEIMDQYTEKYDTYLKDNLKKVGGDYSKLSTGVAQMMQSDMQTGQVGAISRNFQKAQKVMTEAKDLYDKDKMSQESYNRVLDSIEGFGGTVPDGQGGFVKEDFYAGTQKVDIENTAIDLVQKNGDQYDENGMKYKDINELAASTLQSMYASPGLLKQLDDIMWANTPGWDQLDPAAKVAAKKAYMKNTAYRAADRYDYQQHKEKEITESEAAGLADGERIMRAYTVSDLHGVGISKGTSRSSMFENAVGGKIITSNLVAQTNVDGMSQEDKIKRAGQPWIDAQLGRSGVDTSGMTNEEKIKAAYASPIASMYGYTGGDIETEEQRLIKEALVKQTNTIRNEANGQYIMSIAKRNTEVADHLSTINNESSSNIDVAKAAKEIDKITSNLFVEETPRYNALATQDEAFVQQATDATLSGNFSQLVLEGVGLEENGEGLGPSLREALLNANNPTDKTFSRIKIDGEIKGTHSSYPAGAVASTIMINTNSEEGIQLMKDLGLGEGENALHIITMHGEYGDTNETMRANSAAVNNSPNGMVVKYGKGPDGTAQKQTWVIAGYAERKDNHGVSSYVPQISRYAKVNGRMQIIPEVDGDYLQGKTVMEMPRYFSGTRQEEELTAEQINNKIVNIYM